MCVTTNIWHFLRIQVLMKNEILSYRVSNDFIFLGRITAIAHPMAMKWLVVSSVLALFGVLFLSHARAEVKVPEGFRAVTLSCW